MLSQYNILQVYYSVVSSIESDGGRVLTKHSVVVVHSDAVDDVDCVLLCYDRDATALLVPSRYVRHHDDLPAQPWYHPVPLTSHQAALFLRSNNQPGCFLVYRDADTDVGDYQLAVCLGDDVVVHYVIHTSPLGDCAIDGDHRRFLSVCDLIKYYQQNAGLLATRLRRPLHDTTCSLTHRYHIPADVELDRRRLHFTSNIVVGGSDMSRCTVVWSAVYDGQPVAIKVLQRQHAQSHTAQLDEEFLNEANIMIGLKHDNIAVSYTHLTLPTKRIV